MIYKKIMADFKTIDNLGVEISSRYATAAEDQEASIVKDAGVVSPKTRIDVSRAVYTSAFDTLLGTRQRATQWARIASPKGFANASLRIFTHHLLPDIRTDEFGLLESERIRAIQDDEEKKRPKEYDWEEQIEKDEQGKECQVLLTFFDSLQEKDKNLIEINGRRRQYQKG